MTTFYLIRHGSNDYYERMLVGRKPGVHLNEKGKNEAKQLAEVLANSGIQRILSSPLERCRETAQPIAARHGLPLEISEQLQEVDFGDWSGKTFEELNAMEGWQQWNSFRSLGHTPGGETMVQVQARMVEFISRLHQESPGARIALVSHADPLRAALLHFLATPLEFIRRLDLSPASVSILRITDWDAQIGCVNWTAAGSALVKDKMANDGVR